MIWDALVLAGGRGSRMNRPEPKPLVPIGGRALVVHNVLRALAAGARAVFVAVHHRGDEIGAHLDRELGDDAPVRIVREPVPLGTIGALGLLPAASAAAAPPPDAVVTINGDLLSAIALDELVAAHRASGADATIATHAERHQLALGEVVTDPAGRVTGYREKPVKEYRISSGTNAFGSRVAALVEPGVALGVPELVARAIANGYDLREHRHDRAWIDVNDVDDVARAATLLAEHRAAFEWRDRPRP
ncbi:MAG: NDP-sugar synthase [Planctomycetes bacterium]|nr:NDP-sugar synthase [Planctomycetota bacterium]